MNETGAEAELRMDERDPEGTDLRYEHIALPRRVNQERCSR